MSEIITTLLRGRPADYAARVLVTFPFWGSGLDKLFNPAGGVATMQRFGLEPAIAFNAACILTLLGGSALVIAGRATWLGAGALGVFTALTIPIVHRFWALPGEEGLTAFHFAAEHVGMIGGLVAISILAARREPATTRDDIPMPSVVLSR
jgi:transmembrane protein